MGDGGSRRHGSGKKRSSSNCPACRGKHRAHTCGKRLRRPVPGEYGGEEGAEGEGEEGGGTSAQGEEGEEEEERGKRQRRAEASEAPQVAVRVDSKKDNQRE